MRKKTTNSSDELARRDDASPAADFEKVARQVGNGNRALTEQLLTQSKAGHPSPRGEEERARQNAEVLAFTAAANPQDPLEAALIAQLCSLHAYGTNLLWQAAHKPESDVAGLALRVLPAFREGMDTLDRHRGRGHQVVRVEHINAVVVARRGEGAS